MSGQYKSGKALTSFIWKCPNIAMYRTDGKGHFSSNIQQELPHVPPCFPCVSLPSLCPFVCPTFSQRVCQRNWTRQLSNPPVVSEDGRWSPVFLPASPFLLSWFTTETCPPTARSSLQWCGFARTKGQGGRSRLCSSAGWGVVGSGYYPGAGWPWRGHRPLLLSQWHLYSRSPCNNFSHTALLFPY